MILPSGTVKRIHVDRHVIAHNRKHGTKLPHWTIQTSQGSIKCRKWKLVGQIRGSSVDEPVLSCGARVYMVTYAQVEYR